MNGSERSPYCGRLDDHEPHEWLGRDYYPGPQIVRECPGAPVIEGGNPAAKWEAVEEPLGPQARALAKKHCRYDDEKGATA